MIISDLNHLEVVSEATSITGGGKKKYPFLVVIDASDDDIFKDVEINVDQDAAAAAKHGDANATNNSTIVLG